MAVDNAVKDCVVAGAVQIDGFGVSIAVANKASADLAIGG